MDARYGEVMDQRPVPYVDALREHAARDPARLYVPGHKGGPGADPALTDGAGARALEMDIPALIPGIDVGPGGLGVQAWHAEHGGQAQAQQQWQQAADAHVRR